MSKTRFAVVGDSLSQGFQHGAISDTTRSFPAILARSLGLDVPNEFRVPFIPGPGLPLNVLGLVLELERRLGPNPDNFRLLSLGYEIKRYLDETETYYEQKLDGYLPKFGGSYHNLAVWGFSLAESLRLDSKACKRAIEDSEGFIEDDFLGLPSGPMYRTANWVLNPKKDAERARDTQLDALDRLLHEGPLDALVLWLGANDALGTVLTLSVAETPDDASSDPIELLDYNLTSRKRFARDYAEICEQVATSLRKRSPNTKVLVGNVPHVTIPPVMRGLGAQDADGYFERYQRYFVNEETFAAFLLESLSRADVRRIDTRIDEFNQIIAGQVRERGPNWSLVDTANLLKTLAVRRNRSEGQPEEPLRRYLQARDPDHPLLKEAKLPSALMFLVDEQGRRTQGGLFGLDGTHPSTTGYGLVAELFLDAMQAARVPGTAGRKVPWSGILAADPLLRRPLPLWHHLITKAERWATVLGLVLRAVA
jgi:lysophospholipase L1-like esterase